jgi:hypothetical protein
MANAIHSTARAFGRLFERQIVAADSMDDLLSATAETVLSAELP